MPELPDVTAYVEALAERIQGRPLLGVRVRGPFLLRTYQPRVEELAGRRVIDVRRLGKQIVLGLEGAYWLIFHLMIAGRLHWKPPGASPRGKNDLAGFDFDNGVLVLTEAGTKRRASLHVVLGRKKLAEFDAGGIEPLEASREDFIARLASENHTLKRCLTSPRLFAGIGNAYSDEILHRARLSPVALSQKLSTEDAEALWAATRAVLAEWVERLRRQRGADFPVGVTAFRPEMNVHGRFGQACPVCQTRIQRIRHAENETNYCPRCQTNGRVLADRSLSRLLKEDWPRTVEEWESFKPNNDPPKSLR